MTRTPCRGFTLIELLVVIAIIGVLSSVVLASLNAARERGREASIRSTLSSMVREIELLVQDNGGDYSFVNNCENSGHVLEKYVSAMTAQGATVRCDSFSVTGDAYSRWGVTAYILGASELTAFSAEPGGVYRWDSADGNGGSNANWVNANAACASVGKRLPSPEAYRSLWKVTSVNPAPGFQAAPYWTSTEFPNDAARAFVGNMGTGNSNGNAKTSGRAVRCVS